MTVLWHKMSFGRYVAHEINRPGFRPFLISMSTVFGFIIYNTNKVLTPEILEQSPYYQLWMAKKKGVPPPMH